MSQEQVNNPFDVFSVKPEEVKAALAQPEYESVEFYNPDPANAASGKSKYIAVVKPLVNIHDPLAPIVSKIRYSLPDGSQYGLTFDSAKTLGRYEACPAAGLFGEFWQTQDEALIDTAKSIIKRKQSDIMYVRVIKDDNQPDLVGRVMPMRVTPIMEMINNNWRPTDEYVAEKIESFMNEGDSEEEARAKAGAIDIFDVFFGPALSINVGTGDYGRDWSGCKIVRKPISMFLGDENMAEATAAAKSGDADALQKLQAKAVEIFKSCDVNITEKYGYKALDEQGLAKVNEVVAKIRAEYLGGAAPAPKTDAPATAAAEAAPSQEEVKAAESKPATETTASSVEDDVASQLGDLEEENLD